MAPVIQSSVAYGHDDGTGLHHGLHHLPLRGRLAAPWRVHFWVRLAWKCGTYIPNTSRLYHSNLIYTYLHYIFIIISGKWKMCIKIIELPSKYHHLYHSWFHSFGVFLGMKILQLKFAKGESLVKLLVD